MPDMLGSSVIASLICSRLPLLHEEEQHLHRELAQLRVRNALALRVVVHCTCSFVRDRATSYYWQPTSLEFRCARCLRFSMMWCRSHTPSSFDVSGLIPPFVTRSSSIISLAYGATTSPSLSPAPGHYPSVSRRYLFSSLVVTSP